MLHGLNIGRLCHFFKTGAILFSGPVIHKIQISGKEKQPVLPDLCYQPLPSCWSSASS